MHASRDVLPVETLGDAYETGTAEWGEYTAYFERTSPGTDYSAYYDSCECPHRGYVFNEARASEAAGSGATAPRASAR